MSIDIFKNKTLLIVGGTGSFGNAVLTRFIHFGLKEIRIFSRDEKKQHDMRLALNNPILKFYIGDVRNYDSLNVAMKNVDFIFHAAALKQVPSCEFFPLEATYTNVIGTDNVIRAGIANRVRRIICLSTDKAAYPINAMGITKALMEKVVVAASRNVESEHTTICLTRYGNVLASRGSVVPYFITQVKAGKPITVTDPNMTRFLMTLDDAVDLVLFAFINGNQGDLFVQKAPATTVGTLAEAVNALFGDNSEITRIGVRHGEKLYETLCTKEEMLKAEDLGNFYRIPADTRDLNYENYFENGFPEKIPMEDYNSHNTERLDLDKTIAILRDLDEVKIELKKWENSL